MQATVRCGGTVDDLVVVNVVDRLQHLLPNHAREERVEQVRIGLARPGVERPRLLLLLLHQHLYVNPTFKLCQSVSHF